MSADCSSVMASSSSNDTRFRILCTEAGITSAKLIFLGGGNMAMALIEGAVKTNFIAKQDVVVTLRSAASHKKWKDMGYENVYTDNTEALKTHSGLIVFAVKPQARGDLFKQIDFTQLAATPLIISLMAGVSLERLRGELTTLPKKMPLSRLHPNTAALVGHGAAILSADPDAEPKVVSIVEELAKCVGTCTRIDEKTFDAAGVLAGCAPAWGFMAIEALADGGVYAGVPRAIAMQLAAQSMLGAATMVLESGEHPGALKDKICSPAGTTIAGVRELEKAGTRAAFIDAVAAAAERTKKM